MLAHLLLAPELRMSLWVELIAAGEMQMLVSIQHVMDLSYSGPISECTMDLRLAPRSDEHQTLRKFKFVAGHQATVFEYSDWQGNRVHHVSIGCSHDRAIKLGTFRGHVQPVVKLSLRGLDLHVNRNTEWFQASRLDNERGIES